MIHLFVGHAAANDVTKQKDLSKFHRHLLNRLDRGAVEEKPREEEPTMSQRRTSGEKSSHSERERERERRDRRDSDRRRSEGEDGHERQREQRRSGKERRRSRHHSDRSNEGENPAIPRTIESENGEQQAQREKAETDRVEEEREEKRVEGGEQTSFVEEEAPKLPSELTQEDREERRKVAAAKRTDSQAQLSAKERYLARKRARTSAPVITKDD